MARLRSGPDGDAVPSPMVDDAQVAVALLDDADAVDVDRAGWHV